MSEATKQVVAVWLVVLVVVSVLDPNDALPLK
jgi:hypothetical protein